MKYDGRTDQPTDRRRQTNLCPIIRFSNPFNHKSIITSDRKTFNYSVLIPELLCPTLMSKIFHQKQHEKKINLANKKWLLCIIHQILLNYGQGCHTLWFHVTILVIKLKESVSLLLHLPLIQGFPKRDVRFFLVENNSVLHAVMIIDQNSILSTIKLQKKNLLLTTWGWREKPVHVPAKEDGHQGSFR